MDWNEISHDPRHLGVLSSVSKMIFELLVHSAQTVHLSYIKINTISKWTKTSILFSLIVKRYHRVHPKWFLSLWYIWRKPCTYLAPTLTPSPNAWNQDSTGPTSPRSTIRCVWNNFLRLWYVRRKLCTYLASRLALSLNAPKQACTWSSSPTSTVVCVQKGFWA